MAKKEQYFAQAERLYVEEYKTLKEIGSLLNLNEKTVRAWRNEGQWESKRETYLKTCLPFHEEIFHFSKLLMDSIKEDLKNNKKVDQGRFYTFTKLLPLISKVKEYEESKGKPPTQEVNNVLSDDVIEKIQYEILGIPPQHLKENPS